jgi:membrane-bound lytic murein transglycosylase D
MEIRHFYTSLSAVLALLLSGAAVADDAFSWQSNAWGSAPVAEKPVKIVAVKAAPAPAEVPETAAVVQPDDLWVRLRSGFAIEDLDTPLVKENEDWYANRPEYVQRMVERSRRYLYYIVDEVERRGMPTEIALLPVIESAFNPRAYSHARASGIWQFIPSTGKNFGLQQNFWYDGRRDIAAATHAALDYLQKLYDMFGDWPLALAAYNWGEGSVARAIAKNQRAGLPTDYLSLNMPAETRSYVPRLLAVKHLVADPASFGMALASIPNRPYFTTVATPQSMDVKVAAKLAGISLDEFESLNPAHNRPVIHAQNGKKKLLLPVDKVETFTANLDDYDKPLVSWKTYTPKRGERFDKIASRFGISLARLKDVNDLGQRSLKSSGQPLLVPAKDGGDENSLQLAAAPAEKAMESASSRTVTKKLAYAVKKGDTLASIARRFDVSVAEIKRWNKLKGEKLALKQKLTIETETVVAAKSDSDGKRVKAVLAASEKSDVKGKQAKADKAEGKRAKAAKATRYVIRKGDTLAGIARKFNVAVNDIQRWNNLSAKRLMPGTAVTVYPSKDS